MFDEKHHRENVEEAQTHLSEPVGAPHVQAHVTDVLPIVAPNKEHEQHLSGERMLAEKLTHQAEPVNHTQAEHPVIVDSPSLKEIAPNEAALQEAELQHTSGSRQIENNVAGQENEAKSDEKVIDEDQSPVADNHEVQPDAVDTQQHEKNEDGESPAAPRELNPDGSNPSAASNKSDRDSRRKAEDESLTARQPSERFKRQQEEREKRLQYEKEHPVAVKEKKAKPVKAPSKGKKDNLLKKRRPEDLDNGADNDDQEGAAGKERPEGYQGEEAGAGVEGHVAHGAEEKNGKSLNSRGKKVEKSKEKSKRSDSKKRESSSTKKGKADASKDKADPKKSRSASKSAPKKAKGGKDKEESGKEDKGRKAVKTK
jgi:hypothetical protein